MLRLNRTPATNIDCSNKIGCHCLRIVNVGAWLAGRTRSAQDQTFRSEHIPLLWDLTIHRSLRPASVPDKRGERRPLAIASFDCPSI